VRSVWPPVWVRYTVSFTFLALIMGIFALVRYRSPNRGLPYHDHFTQARLNEWQQIGGTWSIDGDTVRNDSDERGAKLIAGSQFWTNYKAEADLQLLGRGDAGIIIRASDVDYGVDSYSGYYAGLRMDDQSLVLGRAEYGWLEFPPVPMPGGVSPNRWYHLTVSAYDCRIHASATALGTGERTSTSVFDPNCGRSGKIGLRDVVSGGVWRHVEVHRLNHDEDAQPLPEKPTPASLYPTSQGPNARIYGLQTELLSDSSTPTTNVVSIGDLRLLAGPRPVRVTVRGTVTLVTPRTYIQDATGGAEVVLMDQGALKLGDEIEVTGDAHLQDLSVRIESASKRSIAGVAPVPAFSITPLQAATGRYDGMFVELEGRVDSKLRTDNSMVRLQLTGGQQEFYGISHKQDTKALFTKLQVGSLVRMRGICVLSSVYTNDRVPFALIVRSPYEIEVLSGPPWWSAEHLAAMAVGMLALGFLIHVLYSQVDQRRRTAFLKERERLAHEMHDTLAQSFAGLDFKLRAIRNRTLRDTEKIDGLKLRAELQEACDLVRHSHDEARRSLTSLRPEILEDRGLSEALSQVGRRMIAGSSMEIKTEIIGQPRRLPVRVVDAFFRIGQEAIANAVQHSHAKHLRILLEYQRSQLVMAVEDDGRGFSAERESEGFGLTGMRRRAEGIHAKLEIDSNGVGTKIAVAAPCKSETPWLSFLSYIKGPWDK
jgi:signal transduction histidine kinase